MKKNLKYKKQGQIQRSDLQKLQTILVALIKVRDRLPVNPFFNVANLALQKGTVDLLSDSELEVVPESVKQSFESNLSSMLAICAEEIKKYYSANDFEPTPEVVEIMREVVKINLRGA